MTGSAPASVPLVRHWIDGKPFDGSTDRMGDVYNPATGELTKHVAFASAADVDQAVDSATRAFQSWRHSSLSKRSKVLFAFREIVVERAAELAAIVTSEHGKVLSDALGEVNRAIEVIEFACGIPHLLKGGYSEEVSTQVDVYSIRQPLGVVRHHQPVQFSRHGAVLVLPHRHRLWQHRRREAEREGPDGLDMVRRAMGRGRAARGRLQRRARRQGGRRQPARAPGCQGRLLRRLDADRPLRLRDRNEGGQARAGARWCEEPHGRAAGRRSRRWRPTPR